MHTSRRLAVAAFGLGFAVVGGGAGCGGDDGGDDDGTGDEITYFQHVKPLVDAKCGGCHSDTGIAPFALTTYDELNEMAGVALVNVENKTMPPWPPNPDCNEYVGDRSLSDDQIELFKAWVEGGRVMGDEATAAPPLDTEQVRLSRVDKSLAMPVAYTPQTTTDNPDDYRCFVIPWTESTTKYVTGFRAVPGNPKVVHHVIAFYAAPDQLAAYQALDDAEAGAGYTCFGGSGGPSRTWVGGWAPGSLGSDMPAGTGIRVEPGSAIVMQVHYNVLTAGAQPDLTTVEVKLDDTVDKTAIIQPWANPNWLDSQEMRIPAGEADVMHAFEFDASLPVGGPFTIWSAGLHMHTLGQRATASIVRADGTNECLLQIDDWNFHWQGSYGLRQPPVFNRGDKLRVECHFDNSPENQPLVGGQPRVPQDVFWGESTTDEMCLGTFYLTPL
jgi:hypothetical protein